MHNKPTNYETFIQTIKPENIPDILQGFCKCSHCTNHYWDGGAAFCHQNANDSNCNKGINEWMSLTTTDYYDIIKNGKKYLYQVPLKYYQELYEIVQLISDYNTTHFTQKEIHTAIFNASRNRQYCAIDTRPDFIYAYYKDLSESKHFTDVLRCMEKHINSDNIKAAIQELLHKINNSEWKLRLKKEGQKNEKD